jgi:UPF0271 protein
MNHISSSNIACGWHAGDSEVMLHTVRAAKAKNVAVGAHPGYPDLLGFGRRNMTCTPDEMYAYTIYQVGALMGICASEGVELQHVKPHGAMYNQAAKDPKLAAAIARAIKNLGGGIILMGLANSAFETAAQEQGIPFAAEAFADRGYMADGSLVPRDKPGAFIHDPNEAAARMLKLVKEGTIETPDGQTLKLKAHTICMHGDSAEAVEMAKVVKAIMEKNGVEVKNLKAILK